MATNPEIERGLHASVKVFDFARGELAKPDKEAIVSREKLTELKRAGMSMNRALTRFAKECFATENRLLLEIHMLRGIMKRECTDRDANRARVFELFRHYAGDDDDGVLAATATSSNANPLTAPSATAVAIDRALASLDRIEQGMRDLAPVGKLNTHGAGLLSAKATRDAKLLPPPPPSKRQKARGSAAQPQ